VIDTAPLYNPLTHRYKGVYQRGRYWRAIVQSPEGKLVFLGNHTEIEVAARAVATYYHDVYGKDWPKALHDRMRRCWKIRKVKRYPYRAQFHRGPSVTGYAAEVRLEDGTWHRIVLADVTGLMDEGVWSEQVEAWRTSAVALVAIRVYRATLRLRSSRPSERPSGGQPA